MTPPRISRRLIARLTPADLRASLVHDLDEAFARRAATTGLAHARSWYRRQAITAVPALLILRYRRRRDGDALSHDGTRTRRSIVEDVMQDGRYAVRALRARPGFTATALLLLTLGIGANTAVFSVVHAVLLRPLPYSEPDRLVLITPPGAPGSVNLPQLAFWREHATVFTSIAGRSGPVDVNLSVGGTSESARLMPISTGFFRTLGIVPAIGREFEPAETRTGGPRALLVGDALWRRMFRADPNVVGRSVTIGSASVMVVGVLPKDLWLPEPADAFYPLRQTGRSTDNGLNTEMIARVAPRASAHDIDTEMTALSAAFSRENPEAAGNNFRGLTTMSWQASLVGDVRTNLLLLFGAVALVLLIACSNLAGLLLARFASRQRETAVRLALGATSARLLRQFVVESLLLCLTGAGLGALLASFALDAIVGLVPFSLPSSAPIRLEWSALGFAVSAGLVTGLAFGLTPLISAQRQNTNSVLNAAARTHGGTRRSQRARGVLVVAQVSLSVTLLVGAALLIQSLYRLHSEPLGFRPDGVLTFWTPPSAAQPTGAARWQFESDVIQRLRAVPGVTGVAGINVLPLTSQNNFPAERVGHPDDAIGGMEIRIVTPAYFDVMGMPVKQGRAFSAEDAAGAPPVMIVNETLAARWWPAESPIGGQIVIGRYQGKVIGDRPDEPRAVVGVVADTKTVYLKAPPRPTVYVPSAQNSFTSGGTAWVVRGDLASGLAEQVRRTLSAADPLLRIDRMQPMSRIVAATTADSRFNAWLCGVFAAMALALTAIGLYGLLALSIARRTSELALRIALGASRTRVMTLVVRQGLSLTVTGLAIGLAAASGLRRLVASLLFGVSATDVTSFAAVSALLLTVGLVASILPARRASRVDPLVALRHE